MTQMELTPKLTHSDQERTRAALTHKGMAFWAGTGPAGKTCRECRHWSNEGDWHALGGVHGGKLKPAQCSKYTSMMMGRAGGKVPHGAMACKYFEADEKPLPIVKGRS